MLNWWMIMLAQMALFHVVTAGYECSSACGKNNSIRISSTKLLRCSVKYILHAPFSRNTEQTAPMPQNITADWYITDQNWIGITVKWSQRAIDLTSGNVHGYYLKLEELWTMIKVSVTIKDIKRHKKNTASQDIVNFEYPCLGTATNLMLQPGSVVHIKLHSLPMFRQNDKSQFRTTKLTIPRCQDDQRLSKLDGDYECMSYWKGYVDAGKTATPYYTTNQTTIVIHQRYPDHTIYFVLGGAIVVFATIPILLCMVQRSKTKTKDHASIVLMITNECVFDMIKAHKLVTKLRDQYGLDITTNWENQELIGKDGFQWYQDTINRSTIVIFIFETWSNTNSMKDSGMPAEIRQSMQCVGYSQVAANTDAVILTMKHVECKKISPSGIRIFEGNRNFHKLLRILTGKNVSASLTLDKLLATEQRYSPFETSQPMTVALDCEGQESGFTNSLIRYST